MRSRVEGREPGQRIALVAGAFAAVLVVLALRVAQLTIVERDRLADLARRQHRETVRLVALRGGILDRGGEVLAETMVAPSIYASPRKYSVPVEVRTEIAQILDVPERIVSRRLDSNKGFVWLKRRATWEQARQIARLDLDGVGSLEEGRRLYPQKSIGAHVVGTAGADLRGLEGIELRYDPWMRGPETLLRVQRDGLGRAILSGGLGGDEFSDLATVEPAADVAIAAGATLTLTIESDLQTIVERELALGVSAANADAGTAVLLDPKTGAVVALANVPTYDPNLPGNAGPGARRNRAVSDTFEPGSTFKAIVAAAALEEEAIRPNDSFDCERGSMRIGGWTIHDHHPYGRLSVPEIIQVSSNIGAAKIGERLGRERYGRHLENFGFGRRTSIDLPGEISGIVRPARKWALIDLATASFGQGLSVTPIQLAVAYAAIANGGVLHAPHLLSRAMDRNQRLLLDRELVQASGRQVVSRQVATEVTSMLERVVELEGGTGGKARIPGVRVAGKTGTAQKVDSKTGRYSKERLASFIGFAPADDPALVLLVMIDNPRGQTYGGQIAAPVFREIMTRALDRIGRRSVLADGSEVEGGGRVGESYDAGTTDLSAANLVRSFRGMSLRRALAMAAADGIAVAPRGSGYVKYQHPAPGTQRGEADEVVLYLEPST